jgi:sigma-54 dependent transcriptional regulator, acetoin dehydrogenase operon transcriptional activator AcoR
VTPLSASGNPPIPHTAAAWDRIRAAKLDVLSRDPRSIDPVEYPHVRPEVVTSWRRSMLAGVDPGDRHYTIDDTCRPGTRLAAVAQPIMERLKDEISDLNCWGFLADRACRLLTVVVGDFPQAGRVHRQNLRPGMCFGEDVVGTNGMGCAHETQQAFIISGTEHYRTDTEIITTTGVIIRDPFTNRYVGTLGAHCLREYTTTALLPLVIEIGRSIEAQLLASRTDGEREFFDAFSTAQRRYRGPVIGVSKRLCVLSTRARALVREADEELLRRLAAESNSRAHTAHRQLSSGMTVGIQVLPVRQPRGEFAAILVLQPVGNRAAGHAHRNGSSDRGGDDPPADFRSQLSRALRDGRAVLLTGERGCGKRYEALAALRTGTGSSGDVVEFDGAVPRPDTAAWLRDLGAALRDPNATVLLSHIADLPTELMTTVADLVRTAGTKVIGTTTDDSEPDGTAGRLQEHFPVVVTVPPLRERRDEFSAICASLLAGLATSGEPATLTPRATAALMASDWPGNIRQLLQVLASARIRIHGSTIDLPDLPARHRPHQTNRPLDEVAAAERRVLIAALRETGGDRNAVARRLGISRATVYRKLKRYELN